jgi:hypothetical protein
MKVRRLPLQNLLFAACVAGCLLASLPRATSAQTSSAPPSQLNTNRETDMRALPEDASALVRKLADRDSVTLMERRGPWSRVRAGTDVGWVRMMHLRGGSAIVESGQSAGVFGTLNAALSNTGSGRAQSATVGVRGFSKEDVARASFNPAEMEKLKRFQVSDGDAQRFASQGRLAFRSVAYLAQDAVRNVSGAQSASVTEGRQ